MFTVFNAAIMLMLAGAIAFLFSSGKRLSGKLKEINRSSLEQMDALEKTSANLLAERNILEQKVSERTFELAAANEKLRDLDRAKNDFFANISHELRTPLTLILAPVEEALSGREINKNTLEMIQRNGLNLLSLINDLLDISRVTAGKMKLEVSETDICELLRQCCGGMESAAELKGIELVCNTCAQPLNVFVDREMLLHVVSNFFSNSFKFSEPGGLIEATVLPGNDYALIKFSDRGCGIPGDRIATIFERFTQADTSSTRRHEGTGIGLSLVKDFIDLHRGTVSVESRCITDYPEDHGTVFTVKLLTGKAHLEGRSDVVFMDTSDNYKASLHHVRGMEQLQVPQSVIAAKHTEDVPAILVVEDNADLRHMLAAMLGGMYVVYEAAGGNEAVQILEGSVEIDLVLSDVMMPGMDGHELLRWIRSDERFEGLPVILLTARAESFMKIEGFNTGATDYVTKPFNARELEARIESQIEFKAMRNRLVLANKILYKQLAEKTKASISVTASGEEKAAQVISFIRENYTSDISREGMAAAVDMSPDYLSRVFNTVTGKRIDEYINELRIEKAKELLASSEDTVTSISYNTGFDNIRTFNKVFAKLTGLTPSEYRKNCKNTD